MKSILLSLFTIITLTACSSSSEFPENEIMRKAIQKTSSIAGFYDLDSFEITNSYTRQIKGEEYLTIEYQGEFEMKKKWRKADTFSADPRQVTKSGAFSIVKRGNQWYF